jgi:hypothetical protein
MGAAPALHTETPHGRQTRVDPPQRKKSAPSAGPFIVNSG